MWAVNSPNSRKVGVRCVGEEAQAAPPPFRDIPPKLQACNWSMGAKLQACIFAMEAPITAVIGHIVGTRPSHMESMATTMAHD